MERPLLALIFLVCCAGCLPSPARAEQQAGNEVGAAGARLEKEVEGRRKEFAPRKEKPAKVEFAPPAAKPAERAVSFTLTDVTVTGATVLTRKTVRAIYQPYLGKIVTFQDLETIISRIKARYAARGYLTTIAYLPEQDIKEGKVEIRVAEGKMGKLKIEGNAWFSNSLLTKYVHAKKDRILNISALQRDLLRLNQNSDLDVKAVLTASEAPETSDVVLKVVERCPHHMGFAFDNQGTRLVGHYRPSLYYRGTNITGNNDSLFINTLFSASSFGQSAGYSAPLTTYGTTAGVDYTVFTMKLGKEFSQFEIKGMAQIAKFHISQELFLNEDFEASATAGLEIKSIEKEAQGIRTGDDQLRLPYLAFDFMKLDSIGGGGQTTFSPRFVFGTEGFLGASYRNNPDASRNGAGGGHFFKYEQTVRRIQRMAAESRLTICAETQVTNITLPPSEQLQLGGASSIRGYPEGDYLCDSGGFVNIDWAFPTYLFPRDFKLPHAGMPLRQQLQGAVFVDFGGGYLEQVLPGEKRSKFLAGIGGGLRFYFNRNLYLRIDWAKDIGDRPTPGTGPSTFYISLQTET